MRTIVIAVLFMLVQEVAFGGWVITEKSNNGLRNTSIQTTFIQNNVIRYETPTSIVIINLNTKLITMVFSEYKAYWSGTDDELKHSAISIYDMQFEKMLAGLPISEQKELDSVYNILRQQMLDSTNLSNYDNISILKIEGEQEIDGYNTQKYNILIDSVLIESVWHTTEVRPYDDINIEDMISFMNKITHTSENVSIVQTNEYLELLETGMLLKTIEYLPNSNMVETTVTNIRNIDIVPDFFLPPHNYVKVSLLDALYLIPEKELRDIDE